MYFVTKGINIYGKHRKGLIPSNLIIGVKKSGGTSKWNRTL